MKEKEFSINKQQLSDEAANGTTSAAQSLRYLKLATGFSPLSVAMDVSVDNQLDNNLQDLHWDLLFPEPKLVQFRIPHLTAQQQKE